MTSEKEVSNSPGISRETWVRSFLSKSQARAAIKVLGRCMFGAASTFHIQRGGTSSDPDSKFIEIHAPGRTKEEIRSMIDFLHGYLSACRRITGKDSFPMPKKRKGRKK